MMYADCRRQVFSPLWLDNEVIKDRGLLEVGFIALVGKYIKYTYQIVQDEK